MPPAGPVSSYRRQVAELTPAQDEVLAVLRDRQRPRPSVDAGLRSELRARLESDLAPSAAALDRPLYLSKADLAQVHACEAYHQAERGAPFTWSVATARGTVAHKAIELSVHRQDSPTPLDLVDDAMTRLADDPASAVADFLLGLGEGQRAELRSEANDLVGKFVELWPPLRRQWLPRTESRTRAELCDGRVLLAGKVDLALGKPSGTTAGTLVVDLKSGASSAGHLHDLRFYALLETLRTGVPPFRLASYYLDSGTFLAEEVTGDVLEAAILRTVAGARTVIELSLGLRSASVTPNAACRWCRVRSTCDGARRWEEVRAGRDEADAGT